MNSQSWQPPPHQQPQQARNGDGQQQARNGDGQQQRQRRLSDGNDRSQQQPHRQPQQQQQPQQRRGYVVDEETSKTFHRNQSNTNNVYDRDRDRHDEQQQQPYRRDGKYGYDYERRGSRERPNSSSNSYSSSSRRGGDDSSYYGHHARARDDSYGPPPPGQKKNTKENFWECLECQTWNNTLEVDRCTRCGRPQCHERPRRQSDERHAWRDEGDPQWRGGDDDDDDGGRRRGERSKSSSNNSGNNHKDDGDEEEVDEFGRRKSEKAIKIKNPLPSRREWPPNFDTDSAIYIFDGRSGMFYEAESDFFYDPKTKLYYGNKQATYFRYCGNTNDDDDNDETKKKSPQFVPVTGTTMTTNANENSPRQHEDSHVGSGTTPAVVSRPSSSSDGRDTLSANRAVLPGGGGSMIAINLKTKELPKNKASASAASSVKKKAKLSSGPKQQQPAASLSTPTPPAADPLQKKHAANIEIWVNRRLEIKQDEIVTGTKAATAKCEIVPQELQHQQQQASPSPPRTSKGEPICTLCQRKFATLEKLRHHEKASNLHKENLAKKKRERQEESACMPAAAAPVTAAVSKPAEKEYVDRAQQRRKMYESSDTTTAIAAAATAAVMASGIMLPSATGTAQPPNPVATVVRPEDTLGSSNLGHQMLQKLGWKSGTTLGNGAVETNQLLLKDWERIENLAAGRKDAPK